jgi:hypothetical protein
MLLVDGHRWRKKTNRFSFSQIGPDMRFRR